jgi:putative ABC transport system permease protein
MHPTTPGSSANPLPPNRLFISTIAAMALKNLFRHRRRTVVNLIGIAVAVGALLFFQAFYRGSYEELMFGAIVDYETAHLQVQSAALIDEDPDSYAREPSLIGDWQVLCGRLRNVDGVRALAPRLLVPAFAGDGVRKRAVFLVGMDQAAERETMRTLDRFSAGRPLSGPGQVLVGASLARLFGLQPGSQLRVQVRTVDGVPNIQTFTITGFFVTGYALIDRGMVFASLPDVQEVSSAGDRVNRIHIRAASVDDVDTVTAAAAAMLSQARRPPDTETARLVAKPWTESAAGLLEHTKGDRLFMLVFLAILLVLALSSIAGTMYMAVFERTREIGTLRAMGWHRGEVFQLFVLEAALIGITGSILGIILGGGASIALARFPIDLSGSFDSLDIPFLKMTARLTGLDAVVASLAGAAAAAGAGITPARRAASLEIVRALTTR